MTLAEAPLSSEQQARIAELEQAGFVRLGKSDLFVGGDAVIDVQGDGTLNIMVDYSAFDKNWSEVRGFQIGGEFYNGLSIISIKNDVVLERTLNGSGGGYRGDKEQVIKNIGDRTIEQQLIDSGFRQDNLSGETYRLQIGEKDGGGELIAVVSEGRISRLLKPIARNSREFIGKNFRISNFRVQSRDFGGEDTIISIQNDLMTLEVEASYWAHVVEGSQRLLRPMDATELGIEPFPKIKESSGFVVGGVNDTDLIRSIDSLAGQSIADLEKRMRPDQDSMHGFLGEDESLLEVMARDNDYVRGLGLTHQEIAAPLHYVRAHVKGKYGHEFTYHDDEYRVDLVSYMGLQSSPFEDGTSAVSDMTITNLTTGEKLFCSELLPDMIERYGFYEGKGTPYRLEPESVVRVFGLQRK